MSNVSSLLEPQSGSCNNKLCEEIESVRSEQASTIALIADVLDVDSLDGTLDALADSVQRHIVCGRVYVALVDNDELTLRATSQQAFVDRTSSEAKLLVGAMQEACDRESIVCWPNITSASLGVLEAHRALAGRRRSISYCSVPIYHEQQLIAAMLLERRDGFAFMEKHSLFLSKIAAVAAPILSLRFTAERGVYDVCRERINAQLVKHLGSERPGMRFLCGLVAIFCLGAVFIPVESHIGASAELVPLERRLITAPRAGFVKSVNVVAGELVESDQLLATLDSRDLELEVSRSAGEIATAEVEFRAAMANFDRQASAVTRARLAQARAQQLLVERQLEQSSLTAPMTGIVLNADPSHSLGAPVSRGDTLFEIAPAAGYEIHLLVDESDIRDIYIGQEGELSLRARPKELLDFTVASVHPIAESTDGASRFRVTANLVYHSEVERSILHPGESGQAKLDAGNKSLFDILSSPIWRRITELKWRLIG